MEQKEVNKSFNRTADKYDDGVKIATLGLDELWKIRMRNLIPADRQYNRILG